MEYFPRANWYTYSIFTFKFVALLPTLLMKNASEKTRTEDMRTQQSNADVSLPDGMVLLDILYLLQAKLHVKEKLETHDHLRRPYISKNCKAIKTIYLCPMRNCSGPIKIEQTSGHESGKET